MEILCYNYHFRLENHHASEIHELEKKQELEIAKLKEEFDEQKTSLVMII